MKPIIDTRGNQLGMVDDQGRILDRSGHILGYQGQNGQVVINNHIVGSTNNPQENLPFMFNGSQKKNR